MASKPRSSITRAESALNAPGTSTPRLASTSARSACLVFICFVFASMAGSVGVHALVRSSQYSPSAMLITRKNSAMNCEDSSPICNVCEQELIDAQDFHGRAAEDTARATRPHAGRARATAQALAELPQPAREQPAPVERGGAAAPAGRARPGSAV